MSDTEIGQAKFCSNCGSALVEHRCPQCATSVPQQTTAVDPGASEGWSSLPRELLSNGQSNGFFSVVWSFLLHPVKTILRLTDDPTYRSHWGFLSACLGAQLTLSFVLLPHLSALVFGVPDTSSKSAVLTNEMVQYAGIAILTPIQFYMCRALGTLRRTPMSYLKLCVLSVSYCTFVSATVAILFLGAVALLLKLAVDFDPVVLAGALGGFGQLAIISFVTASHRRFWGMTWPVALTATLVIAALSWLLVYPALTSLARRADISGMLEKLFS